MQRSEIEELRWKTRGAIHIVASMQRSEIEELRWTTRGAIHIVASMQRSEIEELQWTTRGAIHIVASMQRSEIEELRWTTRRAIHQRVFLRLMEDQGLLNNDDQPEIRLQNLSNASLAARLERRLRRLVGRA
jgi:hypothetical protein